MVQKAVAKAVKHVVTVIWDGHDTSGGGVRTFNNVEGAATWIDQALRIGARMIVVTRVGDYEFPNGDTLPRGPLQAKR
jgi:hypothetical protein